uniref:Putative tail protein n=1 Tax=viral metagenome TaxID=1070528 RepID=A0A6H1ZFW9_9ZZZZ
MKYTKYHRIPYLEGGSSFQGVDCWGLVRLFYREEFGVNLPDYGVTMNDEDEVVEVVKTHKDTYVQICGPMMVNGSVISTKPPFPSIVLLYHGPAHALSHVGVYIGNRQMIHVLSGIGSYIQKLDNFYWARKVEGFYVPGSV